MSRVLNCVLTSWMIPLHFIPEDAGFTISKLLYIFIYQDSERFIMAPQNGKALS